MTRTLKADQTAVRAHNRAVLLNLLRRLGPSSRVQLQKLSGLSGAAVTGVTAALIQEGLVVESSAAASTGGRPPILLALNYQAQAAIGAKLKPDEIDLVLTDGGANIERQLVLPLTSHSPAAVVQAIATAARHMLDQTGRQLHQLMGVGVGLPGLIDSQRGICVHSPILTWQDVPIAALLSAEIGCPAFVDNDVNALTVAEQLFGGEHAAHLLVVTVGRGIGLGLLLNGQLHRGQRGGAGEFGHTVSEAGGRLCECGNRGCLEAYAAEPALVARYNELSGGAPIDIDTLIARHAAGDPRAVELFRDAAERIGVALASLVNVLNPERILISGEGTRLGPAFFHTVEATLRRATFRGLADHLALRVHDDGEFAWARGAASLALQQTFATPPLGASQSASFLPHPRSLP